ncbi:CYTH-like domain-containing protein [Dichotomocladium elegans]|nr:CYTH-like domain-containing protein [Dichotomocladium elegans]
MENNGTESDGIQPGSPKRVLRRLYEPNIFNDKVFDELVIFVGKRISEHISLPNLEIEAKFGLLMDRQTNRRIEMNVLTETVLPGYIMNHCYFMTNMTPEQHQRFNRMFNELVEKSQKPGYKGDRIHYKHTKEIDEYVEQPDRSRFGGKVRVSRDEKTGELLPNAMIKKRRILDLNIYSPSCPFDCRISINTEDPVPKSEIANGRVDYKRFKDRISYSYNNIKFDLTQVKESPVRKKIAL